MNIQSLNSYQQNSQISYKGGANYINKVNPASHYLDKFFNKSAIVHAAVVSYKIFPFSSNK